MIEPNKHYPAQMNGPIISANGKSFNDEFSESEEVIKYLHDLSINTAQETELENIGRIIGYPRPLVPDGFTDENIFIYGTTPLESDAMIGLGTVGTEIGGQLSTIETKDNNKMDLGIYRKLLSKIAVIKRYGLTIASIDKIAATISPNYTITWTEDHDILINYSDLIGFKNVYILTQLFYRLATEPQVIVLSGEEI